MGARWYDAELGRFISPDSIVPDPINPQNFNRYAYVLNNPIKYTDSTGHCVDHYENSGLCNPDPKVHEEHRVQEGRLIELSNMVWNEQGGQAGVGDAAKQKIWTLTFHTALNEEAKMGDARTIESLDQVLSNKGRYNGYTGPEVPDDAVNSMYAAQKWSALKSVVNDTLTGVTPDPSGGITNFGNISYENQPGSGIPAIDEYESMLKVTAGLNDPIEGVSLNDYLGTEIGYEKIPGELNWFVYNTSGYSPPIHWIGSQPFVVK